MKKDTREPYSIIEELKKENKTLRKELETMNMDPLTKLPVRRAGERALKAEIERLSREKSRSKKLTVIFIDGDNIKKVNDSEGHKLGDTVIAEISNSIKISKRKYDYAYRYGGDEFIVILPNTDEKGAKAFLKHISEKIMKSKFISKLNKKGLKIGISSGFYTISKEEAKNTKSAFNKLIKRSDKQMYVDKISRKAKDNI